MIFAIFEENKNGKLYPNSVVASNKWLSKIELFQVTVVYRNPEIYYLNGTREFHRNMEQILRF